jgi:RNA polymerase sigma-70 factor (ECF subfamily)
MMTMEMTAVKLSIDKTRYYDRQALIDIYQQYSDALFRYAFRMLGDKSAAEDCVSETFHRLLNSVNNGGSEIGNVRAYLYRIAHNWVTDYYRNNASVPDQLDVETLADHTSEPAELVSEQINHDRVRTAIIGLPAEQRQVIELRFLEQWSHKDVADALGKSVEATRALQYRALGRLREMLLDEESKSQKREM